MAETQKSVKTVFLGILLAVALVSSPSAQDQAIDLPEPVPEQDHSVGLTAPLSEDSREAWVFLSWTTGGTEEEKEYFDSRLPESLAADGWIAAGTMEESDLFIVADLAYNYDLRLWAITVQLHDSVTGEQISSNAMGYEIVSDMDQWNNLLIEELMKDIPRYPHTDRGFGYSGGSGGSGGSSFLTWGERLWGQAADRYWLYVSPRVGGDLRFYSQMESANTSGFGFDVGVQAMLQLLPWLGIQGEALFTMDFGPQMSIDNSKLNATEHKITASSLMFPVVVMITFRPDEWLIAPFGGVYWNIPLGPMDTTNYGKSNFGWLLKEGVWMSLGWTAGIEVGRKVGPGTFFTDIRFISDLGKMQSANRVFEAKRSGVSISLGYQFAILKKQGTAAQTR